MNQTIILFIYACLLTIVIPPLFPSLHLLFLAPFLIWTFYRQSKVGALWFAVACGIFIDLLSSHTRMGFHAFSYCLTVWILYGQKQNFFVDHLSTLPIMTFLFSFINTVIQVTLLFSFGQGFSISLDWLIKDLILLPALDALYAGVAFTFPSMLLPKAPKRKTRMFTAKKGL